MNEQISLFDYFPSHQVTVLEPTIIIPTASVDQESGTAKKSYVRDVGEELEGARKHLAAAAMAKFSKEWREVVELDPSQAYSLISKEELLSDFNAEQLRNEGFTSEAAFAIKLLWERVCQRPADDAQEREYFIQAVTELRNLLADASNEELFRATIRQLQQNVINAVYSTYKQQVQKDPSILGYRFWLSLGDRFKKLFIFKSRTQLGYRAIYNKAFKSEDAKDWNWIKGTSKAASDTRKENAERWERKVPEEVIRLSQEPSGVSKPEDFLEQFGFRGVQFGNWVEDAAGRYHVLCCGNALADLATILNLPRHAVSMHGVAGLAFGARGNGKAAAHFEPSTNVINMTKHNGCGSLAHEWMHLADWNLFSFSHKFMNGKKAALSDEKAGTHLPYIVTRAFKELMEEIIEGEGTIHFTVPDPLPREEGNYYPSVGRVLERNNYEVNEALYAMKNGNFRIRGDKQMHDIGIYFCNILKNEGKEIPKEFYIPTEFSSYYLDAKKRGAYWKRPHELLARAFESWIEDMLFERGMTNSYLVCGTRFDGPYPQGEERERINAAFRKWWETLQDSGILLDALLWR